VAFADDDVVDLPPPRERGLVVVEPDATWLLPAACGSIWM
jgi:hypothetical protein